MTNYNPTIFGNKPEFTEENGKIYVTVSQSKLKNISNIGLRLELIKNTIKYRFLISDSNHIQPTNTKYINKDNVIPTIKNDGPNLTIRQLYYYILFCTNDYAKKPTYDMFGEFLVDNNVCIKLPKNNNHIAAQHRFKLSKWSEWSGMSAKTGMSSILTPCGVNRILTEDILNFKDFVEKNYVLYDDSDPIIII